MEKQRMNVFQILRATQRLNSPQLRGLQVSAGLFPGCSKVSACWR